MRYDLSARVGAEVGRFTVRSEKGVVYVYRQFQDRWEIHKLKAEDIQLAAASGVSGEQLLEADPLYRIIEGACSCPGFGYHRGSCKHLDEVRSRS